MTIFVDSGVFYAQADRAATRHDAANEALQTIFQGRYGQPYTSDYVYDETVTLTQTRTGNHTEAKRIGRRIRGAGEFPQLVQLRHVSSTAFDAAVDVFERYDDQDLSFTDATIIAFVDEHGIDRVLSFDDDFDGIVDRLDPRNT